MKPLRLLPILALIAATVGCLHLKAMSQTDVIDFSGATSVLPANALFSTPVGGLQRTQSSTQEIAVEGQPFKRALRVVIGADAPDTNATQLTIQNTTPIVKEDVLLASLWVRGAAGEKPAQVEFMFEKSTSPWTKSVTQSMLTAKNRSTWKRVLIPFVAAENYAPREAMASLRLAFGPQTVELADLEVRNFAKTVTLDALQSKVAQSQKLGNVSLALRLSDTRQTLRGFGGNFAQPRYGKTEAMDATGEYNLAHLRVVHARIGIPLNYWTPQKGVYKDEAQAKAALEQMKMMAARKIPITGSVWEGPQWMLPGNTEQSRTLPRENYTDCIEAIAQFLVTARDKYGANVEYFSFNEPDYGVNFKFTPDQMREFIRLAGPRFAELGLKTKFLIADTANGSNLVKYARPILEDKTLAPYLGPIAFHSWDVLGVRDEQYAAIAALGQEFKKPIWCTEAGHDAQLWRVPNPWRSWKNAFNTALAYERTIRLSGAAQMDYWTYQNNYPLVSNDSKEPFAVWHIVRQMEDVFAPGWRVATATSTHDELKVLPTAGTRRGQFGVLLINPIGAGKVTLTGLPQNTILQVVQSTQSAQRQTQAGPFRSDAKGQITVEIPAQSVVTVVSEK